MKAKYALVDGNSGRTVREFRTKRECRFFLMEGLFSCDGSEAERFRDALAELECGRKTITL